MNERSPVRGRPAAVVFDLDGTLIDSFGQMIATVEAALAECGFPPADGAEVRRHLRRGLILDEVYRLLPAVDPDDVPRLVAAYRRRYLSEVVDQSRPMAGAWECLDAIRAAGLPVALATSKRRDAALRAVAAAGLAERLPLIVAFDDVPNHKPAPDQLFLIAQQLALKPTDIMMVGDSLADIACGRAAGATTCLLLSPDDDEQAALAAGPDYVVRTLIEVPPIILTSC